ncbi:DNA-binding response regulator [Kaistia sp. 32K]|uniref:helix-turn-helix transcriptional regulator n=1 Tax=Kaistia sp. 32K TaxID=2795690 RepID=UPI001916096E|nr:response regulator transcription factor [Kaistia sp. 32K]BCP53476.1 DNA-binding response regulator [Kaistia sp. 32K]
MWNADAIQLDRENTPVERDSCTAIALIDRRVLDRECLARGLQGGRHDLEILTFGTVAEWSRATAVHAQVSAILLSIGSQRADEPQVAMALDDLAQAFPQIPTIVLADGESAAHILQALDRGARGYIPTSVGLGIAIEIVNLARAGGLFVPANCLMAARDEILAPEFRGPPVDPLADLLTPRQAAVAEAIRRGKANKIIAYELDLRESTIKVHIRSIMRKLGAHNRTEVAFKLNSLIQAAMSGTRAPEPELLPPTAEPPPRATAGPAMARARSPLPTVVCA